MSRDRATVSQNRALTMQSRQLLEKAFKIDFTSEDTGQHYVGTFVARRPNAKDQMTIVGLKSELLEGKYYDPDNPGYGVPPDVDSAAEMIAFLDVCITDSPEWWEGAAKAYDMELISVIFMEAAKADPFRFKALTASRPDGGSGSGSSREHDGSGHSDGLASMVDEEI